MNNDVAINEILDDFTKGKIEYEHTSNLLINLGVQNPNDAIALHKAAVIALQRNELFSKVSKIHTSFITDYNKNNDASKINVVSSSTGRLVTFSRWMMRAAAVLIVVAGGWFVYQYSITNSDKLYSEMYQSYDVNTDRGTVVTSINPHRMIDQYKQKDYSAVIATFLSLPISNNREKFLTAMAYHETSDYTKSINLLKQILDYNKQTSSNLYNDEAEFFIALNYLKLKNNEEALSWIKAISSDKSHTYNERVSKWVVTRLKWLK